MTLQVDEEENVLSVADDGHEETVQDLIENAIFDIDGMDIKNIKVLNKQYFQDSFYEFAYSSRSIYCNKY